MRHHALPDGALTRATLIDWYRATRARTKMLFDAVDDAAYYERPVALRNPIVFYEGHIPAFGVNTLLKLSLGLPGVDERLDTIFARGIDPADEAAVTSPTDVWPSRAEVQAYAGEAQARIEQVLGDERLEDPANPCLRGGEAVLTMLEHELMHQETLLYLVHQLPYHLKRDPSSAFGTFSPPAEGRRGDRVRIPRGRATLGAERCVFGWDNEFPSMVVDVEEFEIDALNVTNGEYLEFVEATGARAPHFWMRGDDGSWLRRGLFEAVPLPLDAPVYVTHDEAEAYARWKGARLPTEAEYHRAAFGTPSGDERLYPWGDELPDATRGNFDFAAWDPVAAGSYPAGASAWGVDDLVGNGWEWTSTIFEAFPGFEAMPSYALYSADFFDGAHYVLKGASPVTPRELVRRSFRNWFRPNYPFVYATFRCAR